MMPSLMNAVPDHRQTYATRRISSDAWKPITHKTNIKQTNNTDDTLSIHALQTFLVHNTTRNI